MNAYDAAEIRKANLTQTEKLKVEKMIKRGESVLNAIRKIKNQKAKIGGWI